jgi:hypothetical protein
MRKSCPAVLCVAFLVVSGCGGAEIDDPRGLSADAEVTGLSANGISLTLPRGWDGRIYRLSPESAVAVEAATASLPPPGSFVTAKELDRDDAYLVIDDIGAPPPGLGREKAWELNPPLPIVIRPRDLQGPWEGGYPFGAARSVVLANRALMIRVRFGAAPDDRRLAEVNELLASLVVDPAETSASAALNVKTASTQLSG